MAINFPYISGDGIPNWLYRLLQVFRVSEIITKSDLVDYGLINEDGDRLDDSGDPIE